MVSDFSRGLALCSALSDGDVASACGVGVLDSWRALEREGTAASVRRHPVLSRSPRVANALAIDPTNAANGLGYLVMVCTSSMMVNAQVYRGGMASDRQHAPMFGRRT
jgi:hypothetical protein